MKTHTKNFYAVLGVTRNATTAEIKKAYRKKAVQCHPDKKPGNKLAEEAFKDVAIAYETLMNEEKRYRYDQELLYGSRPSAQTPQPSRGSLSPKHRDWIKIFFTFLIITGLLCGALEIFFPSKENPSNTSYVQKTISQLQYYRAYAAHSLRF